jgi:ribosomal protein S18 acetylase RimI-like enzyme
LSKTAFQQYGPYDTILPQWFQEGTTLTLLAQEDERAAGFVMLSRPAPDWALPHLCELLAIAVVPSRQRSGIGGVLLDEADAAAAGLRVDRIVLHTAVENIGAQSLFSRHGYVPVHIKNRFYSKGQNALMMVKALS